LAQIFHRGLFTDNFLYSRVFFLIRLILRLLSVVPQAGGARFRTRSHGPPPHLAAPRRAPGRAVGFLRCDAHGLRRSYSVSPRDVSRPGC
jgi:hypothetical protein